MIVTQHFNFHADNFSTDRPTAKLKRNKFFLAKNVRKNVKTAPEMKIMISHFFNKHSLVFIHYRKRKMIEITVIMHQVI